MHLMEVQTVKAKKKTDIIANYTWILQHTENQ